ncbi:serine/threonine transporter [Cardiobacterium valvarum]|uniref:Serine transporter n=2 Tax=Cardiobacterium valvarum TaxID=194702 RepID=A0A381EF84_9GAMM|nr:serine/threonine transporter [Cardiobacterium valvarum]EHM55823.1 serine transporter [Cardiobacterium valvarum F0432]SUX25437.1 Serine transporter [Cardiobacterium valvarum]
MNTFYKSFNFTWALSLFGTAVGAGVLFLPINAGMGGFWPLIIMTILVGPMTYFAHRGLARFVLSSQNPGQDITYVVQEHFGKTGGRLITLLYFLAIYPILLIYGVGITNTVISFMEHQMHMAPPSRAVVSFVLIGVMIAIMLTNENFILKVTNWLVYPLIAILFGLTLYLIPHWNGAILREVPSARDFVSTLWLTIPVLVFAFNHSPAISSCAVSHAHHFPQGSDTDREISKTLRQAAVMLVAFVMLFVFSCVLSLTPADLSQAKAQNISILSYLANHFDNPIISYFGPFVAFLAISSSFFGHYFGAREGLEGLVNQLLDKPIEPKKFQKISAAFFMITLWIVAILNPSILGFIESLSGPVIAMILFIMPMYAIRHVPALQRFRGTPSNVFVVVMGSIAISAVVYKLF